MVLFILSFPNEILIHIISQISNADLDNFTSTCRIIRALATDTLREHRNRQKEFRHIIYGRRDWLDERKSTEWVHPTLMLRDLVRGDLLCYPVIFSLNKNYGNDTDRYPDVDRALKSFVKDVGPLVEMCTCFDGDEDLSRGVLEEGDIGATLGLLLNVLPNLKKLEIKNHCERSLGNGSLKRILDSMLTTSQKPPRGSIQSTSKLESVLFRRRGGVHDRFSYGNLSTYTPLFHFPSMRYIRAQCLTSEDSWAYPGVQSHINRLEVREVPSSTVNHDSLRTYLKTTQNLLHFSYGVAYSRVRYDASRSQVKEIAQTVLEQAGHSLRYLCLYCLADSVHLARAGDHFIGSLKAFRVLGEIQVGASMLVEPVETRERIFRDPASARSGRVQRLIDILTPSVVRIVIIGKIRFTESGSRFRDEVQTMLQGLPESKADLLPHLKNVTFKLDAPHTTIDLKLLDACNEAEVEIVIHSILY